MSAAGQASLIIATAGLSLVKDIRGAMSDADKTVAGQAGGGKSLYPTAAYSTPVFHAAQITGPHISQQSPKTIEKVIYRPSPPPPARVECSEPCSAESRPKSEHICLQAPWQIWPWPAPSIALDHFKRAIPLPDMLSKGSLIDIFV